MQKISGEIFDIRLGLPGKGKTLSLTEDVVIPALKSGLDVYCNYWINWNKPNLHLYNDIEEILNVRNCVVVMDEIGKLLDPRNWESENGNIRAFYQLHRHRHVDIRGSTQHISLIAKTALIEVDEFIMCDKIMDGWLLKALWRNFPWIVIIEERMSLKEVKSLDSEFIIKDTGENFVALDREWKFYNKKKLLHKELDENKEELIHLYCNKCAQRQGEQIKKEDTEKWAKKNKKGFWEPLNRDYGYCPKHKKEKLIIRESGMYDTDYEFPIKEKDVIFKAYTKGIKEIPFKGILSSNQLKIKERLEKIN